MIVFLCGSCHALVDANRKITKTLEKLNKYLAEKGLIYQKIIEPIKPVQLAHYVKISG